MPVQNSVKRASCAVSVRVSCYVRSEDERFLSLDNLGERVADRLRREAAAWRGRTLVDLDGDKIGRIAEVYFDHRTNHPAWVLVHGGLFGTRESIVPIIHARRRGDDVCVPFEHAFVNAAPRVHVDEELSRNDEVQLRAYYGLDCGDGPSEFTPRCDSSPDRPQPLGAARQAAPLNPRKESHDEYATRLRRMDRSPGRR